jgi:hypothetical protein
MLFCVEIAGYLFLGDKLIFNFIFWKKIKSILQNKFEILKSRKELKYLLSPRRVKPILSVI